MSSATTEQNDILNSPARIRVVRSAPGSGKTWLVAELIRRELNDWPDDTKGIAALSFTHVGRDEICKAVGYELAHPHFVGTIDAFLFRYVVRPFLQKCFTTIASPRLIPADWSPHTWRKYGSDSDANVGKGINIFGCVFIDEEDGHFVVAHKPHPAQPLKRIAGAELTTVMKNKQLSN